MFKKSYLETKGEMLSRVQKRDTKQKRQCWPGTLKACTALNKVQFPAFTPAISQLIPAPGESSGFSKGVFLMSVTSIIYSILTKKLRQRLIGRDSGTGSGVEGKKCKKDR